VDKNWVDKKIEEANQKIEDAIKYISNKISGNSDLSNKDKQYLIDKINTRKSATPDDVLSLFLKADKLNDNLIRLLNYNTLEKYTEENLGFKKLNDASSFLGAEACLDSEWVEFDGDIVITDPCYTTDNWLGDGFDLDSLPLCRDTIYGDWSCTTYDKDTGKKIGEFCADAGLVCVDTLENIVSRKPNFINDYGDWCMTLIKNFKGKVRFKIEQINKPDNTERFNLWDYEVRVEGEGVNKQTGKKISFITTQTGL